MAGTRFIANTLTSRNLAQQQVFAQFVRAAQTDRSPSLPCELHAQLESLLMLPQLSLHQDTAVTARVLLNPVAPILAATRNDTVYELFSTHPTLHVIPVVKNDLPLGLIHRATFLAHFEAHYQSEHTLACKLHLTAAPLLVNKNMPIVELSHFMLATGSHRLETDFIITDQGRYLGVATLQNLLRELKHICEQAPATMLQHHAPLEMSATYS